MMDMASNPPSAHVPVLYQPVLDGLAIKADGVYLDGTFGRGGHAAGVLAQLGDAGKLLVMDKDMAAIETAKTRLGADARVQICHGSFAELGQWQAVRDGLDGVLLDLGVSSPQLDVAERGFSFSKDGPLDMRMNQDAGQSAAQWLAAADEREIADVLWRYGEERMSRRIARAIVARRTHRPFFGPASTRRAEQLNQFERAKRVLQQRIRLVHAPRIVTAQRQKVVDPSVHQTLNNRLKLLPRGCNGCQVRHRQHIRVFSDVLQQVKRRLPV